MKRRTIVVEGALAFRMRRIIAARHAEADVQIMILPQLAARLVGRVGASIFIHVRKIA